MPETTPWTGPIEDACRAFVATVPWLEQDPDEELTVQLAFLGGVSAAIGLIRGIAEPAPSTLRLLDVLAREALELTEQVAGVR